MKRFPTNGFCHSCVLSSYNVMPATRFCKKHRPRAIAQLTMLLLHKLRVKRTQALNAMVEPSRSRYAFDQSLPTLQKCSLVDWTKNPIGLARLWKSRGRVSQSLDVLAALSKCQEIYFAGYRQKRQRHPFFVCLYVRSELICCELFSTCAEAAQNQQ